MPTILPDAPIRHPATDASSSAGDAGCPVARTAALISNRWTPLIVRDLEHGPKRFSELERSLAGISPKTLSSRLRTLEDHAIVDRRTYAEVPPRVEYRLTQRGRALLPIIESMRGFGETWLSVDDCGWDDAG